MELLERYLHQVRRYLRGKEKDDTINELRSLIYEQLEHSDYIGNEEEKLTQILKEFGSPRQVCMRYSGETRYINPEIQPLMILVMKIVSLSLPFALIFSRLISYFSENQSYNTLDVLLDTIYFIPDVITALLSALAMIFIVFYFISKAVKPNFSFNEFEFEPKLLPPVPKEVFKVTKIEEMILIIGSIIFLFLINLQPGLIAVYFEGEVVPILNINFEKVLPYLNINIIITLCLSIYHLAKNRKNLYSSIVELFTNILGGIILILLASTNIFNETVLQGYGLEFLIIIFTIIMYLGAVGSIIGGIVKFVKVLFAYNN